MSQNTNPSYRDEDYEGYVAAGQPAGAPAPPISDEDIRCLEEAWNNPRAYELSKDEGFVSSNWIIEPFVDPNRPLLPSRKEIEQLPRRAQVALAARCAHRVLPLVFAWHRFALARAVSTALRAQTPTQIEAEGVATAAQAVLRNTGQEHAAVAAVAAARAYAAARAREASSSDGPFVTDYAKVATEACAQAFTATVQSILSASTIGNLHHLATPARDLDRLLALAQKENWTDTTPVPPSVFGPMWEGTAPEWWNDDPLAEPALLANGERQPVLADGAGRPH